MLTRLPDPSLHLSVPGERQVDVWQVDLDEPGWQTHAAVLSDDERQRASRFLRALHRQRFTHARTALRHVLACYVADGDPRMLITYGEFGKPQLADAAVHFNVSHSEGLALIAVAAVEVGVDVESMQRAAFDINHLDRQICSAAELQQLHGLPAARRAAALYRLWTQKEAWSKHSGHGLRLDFKAVSVENRPAGGGLCIRQAQGDLHLHALAVEDAWCASLCHPAADITVRRRLARPRPGVEAPPASA